jgi:elongation factor G
MDRNGADFRNTVNSMKRRLGGWGIPIVIHLPLFSTNEGFSTRDGTGAEFVGLVDLVTLETLMFAQPTGSVITRTPITSDSLIYENVLTERAVMIETLGELDDIILELFLKEDLNPATIKSHDLKISLRKCTIDGSAVPVLCGAAFRNIGVQPILDAINDFLPSPSDSGPPQVLLNGNITLLPMDQKLVAFVFKVIYDHQKGLLVFVRVYSGTLEPRSIIRIPSNKLKHNERATKLLELYADDYEDIESIEAGNIGAILGLKNVKTGDTILLSTDKRDLKCFPMNIPPPVFVRSVEPKSNSSDKELNEALLNLIREDPSLSLQMNEETGQLLISGMGELHLEIAGERLLDTYKGTEF